MTRWNPKLPLLERLRATHIETTVYEDTAGFLGREGGTYSQEVDANTDGREAAEMIEGLMRYVEHDTGCNANDLDYLDHSPCTCGLRKFYHPKGSSQ